MGCFCQIKKDNLHGLLTGEQGSWQKEKEKAKQDLRGLISPPLIKEPWQRLGADKGRGQVWFSDQLLACQPITATGLKPPHCFTVFQPNGGEWQAAHSGGSGATSQENTDLKRVMLLALTHGNLMKTSLDTSSDDGAVPSLIFVSVTAHLPDPECGKKALD